LFSGLPGDEMARREKDFGKNYLDVNKKPIGMVKPSWGGYAENPASLF
jgi:hypothetical protein